MKSWIFTLGIATTMLLATSCNKKDDYVCTCRDSNGNVESTTAIADVTENDADDACSDTEDALNDNIFDPEIYICKID